jgi:hypothetical protein
MERADFNPSTASVSQLVQEVLRLRADIAIMAANVVQQAVEREWCGEYEQWARITNKQMSRPHCIDRGDLDDDGYVDPATQTPADIDEPASAAFLDGCTCPTCTSARLNAGLPG